MHKELHPNCFKKMPCKARVFCHEPISLSGFFGVEWVFLSIEINENRTGNIRYRHLSIKENTFFLEVELL